MKSLIFGYLLAYAGAAAARFGPSAAWVGPAVCRRQCGFAPLATLIRTGKFLELTQCLFLKPDSHKT